MKLKKRIFRNILLASLIAAFLMGGTVLVAQYRVFEERVFGELEAECGYVAAGLEQAADEQAYLASLSSASGRITLIAADGTVEFDSASDPADMDNHSTRPEVVSALETGEGTSARYSDTQLTANFYFAKLLADGRVLRTATSQKSVLGLVGSFLPVMLMVLLLVLIVSVFFSRYAAKTIIAPINALDLTIPLGNVTYDELAPLLTKMERQRREIAARMLALSEKQREFTAVTENMREGLILLDADECMLTINSSAAQTFGVDAQTVSGKHYLMLNRSYALQQALEAAKKSGAGESTLIKGANTYQVLASTVPSGDKHAGTVVLILDVTDKVAAEAMRREFSANVSHELKTPLTSISGYAEIMKDGVAKPEDTRRFAAKIFDEAGQLMSLIDDIIRLSQLDEAASLPEKTDVDLKAICEDVCRRLQPQAQSAGVALFVLCEPVTVRGIPKILEEIVQNLVDNAIKYNRKNGTVTLTLKNLESGAELRVADTGIGIPEEHLSRVFERFYRVDRSRSKQIGGTGLGLSIVKHSAETHGAKVYLESKLGEGTTISVVFPPAGADEAK
ncbi:MAG TPA: ATP-binding protein [Eubacteriales bacterium]|mgnify:CR=1 FL=1|nr:ATP-binding protein [Eubacteriales bacterium]